jgi:hypothetical protein
METSNKNINGNNFLVNSGTRVNQLQLIPYQIAFK